MLAQWIARDVKQSPYVFAFTHAFLNPTHPQRLDLKFAAPHHTHAWPEAGKLCWMARPGSGYHISDHSYSPVVQGYAILTGLHPMYCFITNKAALCQV